MAEPTKQASDLHSASPEAELVDFVRVLADENQPMCVVSIVADVARAQASNAFDPAPSFAEVESAVAQSLYERLEEQRRTYDTLAPTRGASFILVVRTLADAPVLNDRFQQIWALLAKPHELAFATVNVPVHMGAAIRQPNESADTMADRVGAAVAQARATGSGHILLK